MKIEKRRLSNRFARSRQYVRLILWSLIVGAGVLSSGGCIEFNWGEPGEREALAPAEIGTPETRTITSTELPDTGGKPESTLPVSSTEPPPEETASRNVDVPNSSDLERYMLDLINEDRRLQGLDPVAWDALAAEAARAHAEEMAVYDYLSHWNRAGLGPDLRFALLGGQASVLENVYAYWQRYANGTPAPVEDWHELVQTAQRELMNSPGHRETILNPENTAVGIGMAYHPELGEFRLAQEFIQEYLDQEPLPETARPGEVLEVRGRLLNGAADPLINLDYEPFPEPMSVEELRQTGEYRSQAVFILAETPAVAEAQRYRADITLPLGSQAGYYHVRTWVSVAGEEVLAGDVVVTVKRESGG